VFISQCVSPSSLSSSIGSGQITNLNNGDSAVLTFNGFQETVMVYYNRTNGVIETNVTNIGVKAFTDSNEANSFYAVDWAGVKYGGNPPYKFYIDDVAAINSPQPIYPGEFYSKNFTLESFIGTNNTEAKKGNMTLYIDFGDAEGSWIITP
jgi:hypothetical protein